MRRVVVVYVLPSITELFFLVLDHRYNERGSEPWQRGAAGVGSSVSSTGATAPSSKVSYGPNGSSNLVGGMTSNGNGWSGNGSATADRWSSSNMIPVGRGMTSGGFSNSWTGSAPPPLSTSVYNPSATNIGGLGNPGLGPSGPSNYTGDRYSRH